MSDNPKGSAARDCLRVSKKPAHKNTRKELTRKDSTRVKARKDPLRNLSDKDLMARLEKTRGAERAAQKRIVLYLAEVERRKLYLPRGYASLFEFCTDYLKYSRSSAGRRISAARCIARFPRMAMLFGRGECDLTVLSAIAGIVTKENCAEIASWIKGRSLREVEAFAARRQPERNIRDQVRQIYVMSAKPISPPREGIEPAVLDTAIRSESAPTATVLRGGTDHPVAGTDTGGRGCKASFTFTPSAGSKTTQLVNNKPNENHGIVMSTGIGNEHSSIGRKHGVETGSCGNLLAEPVVVERKFKLQFAVEPQFMETPERIRVLLSTKYPTGITFEMIFTTLMREYLDRHSHENRIKRRTHRTECQKKSAPKKIGSETELNDTWGHRTAGVSLCEKAGTAESALHMGKTDGRKRGAANRTRHIPQSIRDEVFARDGGRCSFISDDGKRCNSPWNLEIDHIRPYAKGGSNTPENLRLLCARHNKLAAEQEYGSEFMKKYDQRE